MKWRPPTLVLALILGLLCVLAPAGLAYAQDIDTGTPPPPLVQASEWQVMSVNEDFVTWRQDINSGCSFSDHLYSLNIPADPQEMSDISYTMSNYDVDYQSTACVSPEVDLMYFNGRLLGQLTGANDAWSVNSWPLSPNDLFNGNNAILIDTDAPNTGCWCVGVGWIEVRARVGFQVTSHTPASDEQNRDFHAGALDLTATFSNNYDPATLTGDTFLLEYRNQGGSWVKAAGSFTQLGPKKARFVPSANLKDGVKYRVTVKGGTSGVKSQGGKTLAQDEVWYFWTVPDLALSDAFDYGNGTVCAPSAAPCAGVELAIFQVARNASMVPGKDTMARVYLRWKKHNDVHADDQVTKLTVKATLTAGGTSWSKSQEMLRPDKYTVGDRMAARNTILIRHTPGASFAYAVEVTPNPQSNATPVKYTANRDPGNSGINRSMAFDFYVYQDGDWAGGAPGAAVAEATNRLSGGTQLVTDMFPVRSTSYTARGVFSVGLNFTGQATNDATCGVQQLVMCRRADGSTYVDTELNCTYRRLLTMRGGNQFVSAVVPKSFCPGATAFALGDAVFMYQYLGQGNNATIAHEIGHIYGISTANSPTNGHRQNSQGIEGYQVRTGVNRSYTDNRDQAVSLMYPSVGDANARWIHNDDYSTLLGTVAAAEVQAAEGGAYLIVTGDADVAGSTGAIDAIFLQELPNDLDDPAGVCTVDLLDAGNSVLSARRVTPGISIHLESAQSATGAPVHAAESLDSNFFTVSLPWDAAAASVRLTCNGVVLDTRTRTAAAPVVDFVTPGEFETLTGIVAVSWTVTDTDSATFASQLQISQDGGLTWQPLTPFADTTSFNLDTANLASTFDATLRVLASDGYNTAYATRAVQVINPLRITGVTPGVDETDAPQATPISILFATEVYTPSLAYAIEVYGPTGYVPGTITYANRWATFTPDAPLAASASYAVTVYANVADLQGNTLEYGGYSWNFVTLPDTAPPFVTRFSPSHGSSGVPLNALVQVEFDGDMDATTFTTASFALVDGGGASVAGTTTYDAAAHRALFIPAANLAPGTEYRVTIATGVHDAAGNALEAPHTWSFTTGDATSPGVRIVGNYSDRAEDTDADGLLDKLIIAVDVEVLTEGYHNLNGRLLDSRGALLEWSSSNDVYLAIGVHRLELEFSGVPIRSNGVNGPYLLDALSIYSVDESSRYDVKYNAYQTYAYLADDFHSLLSLAALPNQLLEWNTVRPNAFNLRNFTAHELDPVDTIDYSVFIISDARAGVTIGADGSVNIAPDANTEVESDVTIRAVDQYGNAVTNTFHVSVQKPRPAQVLLTIAATVPQHGATPVQALLKDQWDRTLMEPVTVTFQTTLGAIAPSPATSVNGTASATFSAGPTKGKAFITARAGATESNAQIDIVTGQAGTHALTVNKTGSGQGTVGGLPANPAAIPHGTVVTLTASPAASSLFGGWSGDCSGTGSCVVTMSQARTVSAAFVLKSINVTAPAAIEGGRIKIEVVTVAAGEPGGDGEPGATQGASSEQTLVAYPYGTVLRLTAEPEAGWRFVSWTGGLSGSVNPATHTVTGPLDVSAIFVRVTPADARVYLPTIQR